jgi:hypothetical protein
MTSFIIPMYLTLEILSKYCTEMLHRDPSPNVGGRNNDHGVLSKTFMRKTFMGKYVT